MREHIEWLNYWVEDANTGNRKRILLLGDSVARDYRKILNRLFEEEGYVIDLLAMSFGIFDPLFINEVEHFINYADYEYQYILFNLGTHHGYSVRCAGDEKIQRQYYYRLEEIIHRLEKKCKNIILISGTPENTEIHDSQNNEIEVRNRILQTFAVNHKYVFIDLYRIMAEKKFLMVDRFHYLEDGYEYIACFIKRNMGFQCEMIPSNSINSLKKFLEILSTASHTYIYGAGKRGLLLHSYLGTLSERIEQYIVSEEFYQCNNGKLIRLKDILTHDHADTIIIVTPESPEIWKILYKENLRYYTLNKKIYTFIEEYVKAYGG